MRNAPVVGEHKKIIVGSYEYDSEVVAVKELECNGQFGWMVRRKIIGIGQDGTDSFEDVWVVGATDSSPRRSASGMPTDYAAKHMSDFDWKRYTMPTEFSQKICRAFIEHFKDFKTQGRGLYIASLTKGSGKTMLSCCLANELMDLYQEAPKFVTAADYVQKVRNRQEPEKYRDASLLILDDYGVQGEQDWVKEIMFSLIDFRYTRNLSTIFTSNIRLTELQKKADREYSRIFDVSIEINLPEESIRDSEATRRKAEFLRGLIDD